ncbi:unnamed protein product [marine sediment metagenome]|uniref:Uncharacterized protein n=1 Tax=marine sediment metagenome TaxID=412755 RepID=X1G740_9ZZZZ
MNKKDEEKGHLTLEQNSEIVVSLNLGEPISVLSKKYKVSETQIRRISYKSGSLQKLMSKKKEEWLAVAWTKHIKLINHLYDIALKSDKLHDVAVSFGILSDKLAIAMGEGARSPLGAVPMNVLIFDKAGEKVVAVTPSLEGLSKSATGMRKPSIVIKNVRERKVDQRKS